MPGTVMYARTAQPRATVQTPPDSIRSEYCRGFERDSTSRVRETIEWLGVRVRPELNRISHTCGFPNYIPGI